MKNLATTISRLLLPNVARILCLLVLSLQSTVIAGKPPYPIIFVHGLTGSDETFEQTIRYLLGEGSSIDWGDSVNVYDVVLNADNDVSLSNHISDVAIDDWYYPDINGTFINIGRRNWGTVLGPREPGNYTHEWRTNSRIFAVNFQEERCDGAAGGGSWGGDLFDQSNTSAIYKQGKALKNVILDVLQYTGAEKVVLVGHSMGGLAIREYLQRKVENTQTWWIEPSDPLGHKVAGVVTIGTPHLGSDFLAARSVIADLGSEAVRDMRYSYITGFFGSPNPSLDQGVYLFGGTEGELLAWDLVDPDVIFNNYDVNCDGIFGGAIYGINSNLVSGAPNPTMPLPPNVTYTWITSNNGGFGEGDGIVRLDRQWLYSVGDTLLTNRDHTDEGADYLSIIRGLDEPDNRELAYKLLPDTNYDFLTTFQTHNDQYDDDWFKFTLNGVGTCQVILSNLQNSTEAVIGVYNSANQPVVQEVVSPTESVTLQFTSGSGQNTYWIHYMGVATENSWQIPNHLRIEHELDNTPFLSNGMVTPPSGPAGTAFQFFVDYSDIDGQAPDVNSVRAIVDGTPITLTTSESNWASGVTFQAASISNFAVATHNYYFTASQGTYNLRYPSSGQLQFVVLQPGSSTFTLQLNPASAPIGSDIQCVATVRDANGNPVVGRNVGFENDGVPGDFDVNPAQAYTNSQGQAQVYFTPTGMGTGIITASTWPSLFVSSPYSVSGGNLQFVFWTANGGGNWSYYINVEIRRPDGSTVQNTDVILTTSAGTWSTSGTNTVAGRTDQYGQEEQLLSIPEGSYPDGSNVVITASCLSSSGNWSGHLGGNPEALCTFSLETQAPGNAVAWSPNGTLVATGGSTRTVHVWNAATWQLIRTITVENGNEVNDLVFSPDGSKIAVVNGRIYVVDVNNGATLSYLNISNEACIDWKGSYIAVGTTSATGVYLFNTTLGQIATYSPDGHNIEDIDFSPSQNKLAVAVRNDANVRILNYSGSSLTLSNLVPLTFSDYGRGVSYSQNGNTLAIGTNENRGGTFNPTTGALVQQFAAGFQSLIKRVEWSPVSNTAHPRYGIIAASDNALTVLYRAADGAPLQTCPVATSDNFLAWSPSANHLGIATGGTVEVVDFTDVSGPIVRITSHSNEQQVTTESILLEGTVTDDNRVKYDTVYVNGSAQHMILDQIGAFSHTVFLNTGDNVLEVAAQDGSCNRSSVSITVNRWTDVNPPFIASTIIEPPQLEIGSNTVLTVKSYDVATGLSGLIVNAFLTDQANDTIQTLILTDDGTNGDVQAGDSLFTYVLNTAGLQETVYGFDVRSVDVNLNEANAENVAFFFAYDYPQIGSIHHEPVEVTNWNEVTVYTEVTDQSGIADAILHFSTNGGVSFVQQSMQYDAQLESYVGVIPAGTSDVAYFISAVDAFLNATISDTTEFTVVFAAGIIAVLQPAGGEVWYPDESELIFWSTQGTVGNVRVRYSVDAGMTWPDELIIAEDIANSGSYSWNPIPYTPSNSCLVKVEELDGSPYGVSPGMFSIGGCNLVDGLISHWNFEQNGTGVAIDLVSGYDATLQGDASMSGGELSLDGSGDFAIIGDRPGLLFGSADFRIECRFTPNALSGTLISRMNGDDGSIYLGMNNGYVGVQVDDSMGCGECYWENTGNDVFMGIGLEHVIVLERIGPTINVWVDDSLETTATPQYLGSTNPPTSVSWMVGRNSAGSNYFNGRIADITISSDSQPAIQLLRPNGGETYLTDTQTSVLWCFANNSGTVDIELSRNGLAGPWDIVGDDIPTSTMAWTWNISGQGSSTCRIAIIRNNFPALSDTSDSNFEIVGPTLTIVQPNGGESYDTGDPMTISWTSTNVTGSVTLKLNRDYPAGSWEDLATGINAAVGTWLWPSVSGPASSSCRARVESEGISGTADESNGNFSISFVPDPVDDLTILVQGNDLVFRWSYDSPACFTLKSDTEPNGTFDSIETVTADTFVTLVNYLLTGADRRHFVLFAELGSNCGEHLNNCYLSFDGMSGYCQVPHSSSFDVGTGSFTIEALVRMDTTKSNYDPTIILKRGGAESPYIVLQIIGNSTIPSFNGRGVSPTLEWNVQSSVSIGLHQWHHLAAVRSGDQFYLYVDGVLRGGPSTRVTGSTNTTGEFDFGAFNVPPADRWFPGDIDEIRFWSVARTQQEIQVNMSLQLTGNEPGLISLWQFNECDGTTVGDAAGQNDGAIIGTAEHLQADW